MNKSELTTLLKVLEAVHRQRLRAAGKDDFSRSEIFNYLGSRKRFRVGLGRIGNNKCGEQQFS